MDRDVVPPCSDLGQSSEHELLFWMSTHVNQRGVIRNFDDRRKVHEVRHLLDGGFIEKQTFESSYRFRLLISCPGEISEKVSPRANVVSPEVVSLARSAGVTAVPRSLSPTGESDERLLVFDCHPSAQKRVRPVKPEARLAAEIFPSLISEPRHLHEVGPLVGQLKLWQRKYGYSWELVEQMMQEFARHPQWYRHKTAWKVFVTKRSQLVGLVSTRQSRDPARFWNRPTPHAVSAT